MGALPCRRDFYYLLGLLVPLFVYNVSLKAAGVLRLPGERGFAGSLDLMLSDIFFGFGYALLMVGLFAVAREGPARWAVIFFFHAVTMLVVILTTSSYLYFRQTGATLDYGAVAGRIGENVPVLAREAPYGTWVLFALALFYIALGPWLLTRFVERWRGRPGGPPSGAPGTPFPVSLGLFLMALAFGSLSLLVAPGPTEDAGRSFARNPVVNVVLTGVREATAAPEAGETAAREVQETNTEEETDAREETNTEADPDADPATGRSLAGAYLAPTPRTEKRNVVLIHLESARARSVTPYNEGLKTMPFLDELSRSSLLAEHARVVVPRSSKGSTATSCGVEPALFPGPEYEPGGIPSPCLAGLLKEQGYRTVWFQSLSDASNSYWDGVLARRFGYEEFYPAETMDREGFQVTNSFGYEEDIMLEPSEGWLGANGYDEPFVAQYFTGTGHYGYDCVPNRYGYEYFSENEELDRYHNCLRMLDHFLENLFDQYKRLGLYENTVFVLYGDHGEGFREHGRYMHGDNPYEEGLRVPLIVHAPGWFEDGERARGLASQIDVLPTVLEILGYEIEGGEYPGYSLLHPLPENRTLMSSCVYPYRCMASLKGTEKYIYHYGDQPDELFDLAKDPLEEQNLASERGQEETDERSEELLEWRSRLDAEYADFPVPPQ